MWLRHVCCYTYLCYKKHTFPCIIQVWYTMIRLHAVPAWISNQIKYKLWGEITYPFTIFNAAAVEVGEWISDVIPYLTGHTPTYPLLFKKDIAVSSIVQFSSSLYRMIFLALAVSLLSCEYHENHTNGPDNKVHGANMGPTWVLSAPGWDPCCPCEPCYHWRRQHWLR